MTTRMLVTGASGFIGAQVVRGLLAESCEVAVLALPEDPLARLADVRTKIEVLRGELSEFARCDRAALSAFAPQSCVHLAWYAEPGRYLDGTQNLAALAGSLELIDALIACGCKHMVAAGTCAEYATQARPLAESDPTRPETLYAASKLALAMVGEQLAARGEIQFAWGRIFFLYGPGEDRRRVIPALILSLLENRPFPASTGEQVRDYLHVDDVAGAFVRIALSGATGVYNIASGEPVTMRDLMCTVGRILSKEELIQFGKVEHRAWDPPYICGDNQRLKALGWTPTCGLEEGLRLVIDFWHRQLSRRPS